MSVALPLYFFLILPQLSAVLSSLEQSQSIIELLALIERSKSQNGWYLRDQIASCSSLSGSAHVPMQQFLPSRVLPYWLTSETGGVFQTLILPSIPAVNRRFIFALYCRLSSNPVIVSSGPVCPLRVRYGSGFPSVSAYFFYISFKFHSFTMQSSDMDAIVSRLLGKNLTPRTISMCDLSTYSSFSTVLPCLLFSTYPSSPTSDLS